ncbi:hypothetical protein MIDIC_110013 [Alphaproteobacteria bacterium]
MTADIYIPSITIDGKSYDFKDQNRIIEAQTKRKSDEIKAVDTEVGAIAQKVQAWSKVSGLVQALGPVMDKLDTDKVSTSILSNKIISCTTQNCATYLSVGNDSQSACQLQSGEAKVIIYTTAAAGQRVSKDDLFDTKTTSVVADTGKPFEPGTLKIKIKDNFKRTYQAFDSKTTSVVTQNGGNGQFMAGSFNINGQSVQLVVADTLQNIVDKINNAEAGVIATIGQDTSSKYVLCLHSTQIGAEFDPIIEDSGGILLGLTKKSTSLYSVYNSSPVTTAGENFSFKSGSFSINTITITLAIDDTLDTIAQRINTAVSTNIATVLDANTLVITRSYNGTTYNMQDNDGVLAPAVRTRNASYFTASYEDVGLTDFGDAAYKPYVEITLANGNSLTSIKDAINNYKNQIGAEAVIQEDGGMYDLKLLNLKTGTANDLAFFNPIDSVVTKFLSNFRMCKAASDAVVSIENAVAPRRYTTNTVSNLIDGTRIYLKQKPTTIGETFSIAIQDDVESIIYVVKELQDTYNSIKTFASSMRQVDDRHKPLDTSVLIDSPELPRAVTELDSIIMRLSAANIGIDFPYYTDAGDAMTLNVATLTEALNTNLKTVREAFNGIFQSSSTSIIRSLSSTNFAAYINNVSRTIDSFLVGVNTSNLAVRSTSSINFDSNTTAVVKSGTEYVALSEYEKNFFLQEGTFYVNNRAITLSIGDSLTTVCSRINGVSADSRINCVIDEQDNSDTSKSFFLRFVQYNGAEPSSTDNDQFNNIEIRDPDNVLSNAFCGYVQTKSLTNTEIGDLWNAVEVGRTFSLNGVEISFLVKPTSIADFINTVYSYKDQAGVEISYYEDIPSNSSRILFKPTKSNSVVIEDLQNIFQNFLRSANTQTSKMFYDTTQVVSITAKIGNDDHILHTSFKFTDFNDFNKGGVIAIANLDKGSSNNEELQIYNFSLKCQNWESVVGADVVWTPSVAKELREFVRKEAGGSEFAYNEVGEIVKKLGVDKQNLQSEKEKLQLNLEEEKKTLRQRYAASIAAYENAKARLEMVGTLNDMLNTDSKKK